MKKIFKYLSFGIIFLQFIFFYNSIEAKDIAFHAKKDNEDVMFQTFIGSFVESTNEWQTHYYSFESTFNKKQFKFLDGSWLPTNSSYDVSPKKNNFGSEYSNLANISDRTVGSYSYIIHNKSFTNYNNSGTTYKYSTSLGSKGAYVGISGKKDKDKDKVSSIEFKRLTNGYQLIKPNSGETAAINVSNNKFTSEYLAELKNNIDIYKAGQTDDGSAYWFWISEPLAWRFDSRFDTFS